MPKHLRRSNSVSELIVIGSAILITPQLHLVYCFATFIWNSSDSFTGLLVSSRDYGFRFTYRTTSTMMTPNSTILAPTNGRVKSGTGTGVSVVVVVVVVVAG